MVDLSIKRLLLKTGSGSALIKGGQILLNFGLTTILARSCGAEGYGLYVFFFAVIQLLGIPAQMGAQVLVVREFSAGMARRQWGPIKGLLLRSFQFVTTSSLVLVLTALLLGLFLPGRILDGGGPRLPTALWGAALLPFLALGNLVGACMRGFGAIVKGQLPAFIIRPALLLALVFGLSIFRGAGSLSPQLAMAIHAATAAVALGVGVVLLWRLVPPEVWSSVPVFSSRRWIISSLSLAGIAGMQILNNQTDILMLGFFTPARTVGIYRVSAQSALVVSLGLQVVNMISAPTIARLHAEKNRARLQRVSTVFARAALAAALPLLIFFVVKGRWFLELVFGVEYEAGYPALMVLATAQTINASAGVVIMLLNMTGKENRVLKGFILSGVLNVILNLLLIPWLGMLGAAIATGISMLVWNILLTVDIYRCLGIESFCIRFRCDDPATPVA